MVHPHIKKKKTKLAYLVECLKSINSITPVNTVSKNRLGADCGSDHELLITKFRFKLKKVGETTRPFRNDLN